MSAAAATVPDQPKLRPLRVLRDALRVYREHCLILWAAALAVFGPLAAADALLEGVDAHGIVLVLIESTSQSLLHLFGDVAYAGIVAAAVIAWRAGGARQGPLPVLRALPWRTIAVLDLLIPAVTVALLLALVVPGVVFYTYVSLAAPVAKIDHVGVREALRRSARLVRGSFWRVLLVLFLVVVVAGVAEQLLQNATPNLLGDLLVNLVVQVLFAPVFGLATVLMVFDLRRGAQATAPQ